MAAEYLSMGDARAQICGELTQFTAYLSVGMTVDEAAAAQGLGPAAGDLYETTLRQLLQLAVNTVHPAPGALAAIRDRTNGTAPAATEAAQDEWRSS